MLFSTEIFRSEVVKLKKLIEVAMPLKEINEASAREKSIRHGHPSTLHLWWARRPLATARAVLFASLVDDPSAHPEKFPTDKAVAAERQRLFKILGELVKWENSGDEKVFARALDEIKNSCGDDLPAVFDPFAGGGTIPLEAQRLGLKAFASDLNPVAVMINKAMIELPALFKNRPPVHAVADKDRYGGYFGAEGLAEDILHYGKLLKSKAFDKLGKLYPKIYSPEHKTDLTVIAWLWARTVPCANPACGRRMPLVHSFKLSTKQKIFVAPVVEGDRVRFEIRHYHADEEIPAGTVNRNGARCLFCGTINELAHVRTQAKAGNLGAQLMAIVAEGTRGRIYLAPDEAHEQIANVDKPEDVPEENLPDKALGFSVQNYGFDEWHKLFTNRQLTALTTFSDLIDDIKAQIIDDGGDKLYADALAVYLSFLIDKLTDWNSSVCGWNINRDGIRNMFSLPVISMTWDFAETNPFSNSSGCFDNMLDWIYKSVKDFPATIYYAFKQRESEDGASTGWETMLTAIIRAGFQITGTWPMRTERPGRLRDFESNALATSVVLVCRKRPPENDFMSKNEFLRALKNELPPELDKLTQATIAPVDMAQAAIGPGMAIYSRCAKVADMTDTELTVRDALRIINAELDEYFNGQGKRFDASTQFCVDLFEQNGFNEISFGDADSLARAKNISVEGVKRIGAVISERGLVRLRKRDEIDILDKNKQFKREWQETLLDGNCAWLWVQSLVIAMKRIGVKGCGELLADFGGNLELLKNLAYRLYNICESPKKKWAAEGMCYNDLVSDWQDILSVRAEFAQKKSAAEPVQGSLF